MTAADIEGVPEAMAAYAGYTPHALPPSMTALAGAPPLAAGLPTGIALGAVGQAVTVAFVARMAKAVEATIADAAAVQLAATKYTAADDVSTVTITAPSAADVAAALEVATKAVNLGGKVIGLAKTATALGQSAGAGDGTDDNASDQTSDQAPEASA